MALNIPLPDANFGGIVANIPSEMIENRLRRAQAERELARSKLPFGGEIPPGPAGQTVGLEMVKMLYGENSPQYQQAKNAYDLNVQSNQARINYQNILSGTAPKRFSTTLGKTAQELEDVKQGYLPGTRTPMSSEEQKEYAGRYGLAILKPTTDVSTRSKNLYARNMDITISKINPEDLTQYSGIKGAVKLRNDQLSDALGKTTPEYKKYQQSLTAAKTLSKQVRQFYGDSITPAIQQGLNELTNPASWLKSPEVALNNYNQFVDLLKSESQTYKQATESPDVYAGEKESKPNLNLSTKNYPKTTSEGKIILYRNGKEYHLPANLMNKALAEGFSLGN